MSAPPPIFNLSQVSKHFAAYSALQSISCTFDAGDHLMLLGSNGAGKSTLLRILAGITNQTSGSISRGLSSSAAVGYAGHRSMLYAQLTVHENLELACSLYRRAVSAIDEIMSRWGIHQYRHHLPKQLSQGLQARVSLARACMIDPEVLLLDEPSAALDQHSVEILLNEIKRLADRHSGNNLVVIATHDIERLAPFSNRILVIENGSIIRDTRSRDSADIDEAIRAYRRLNR